MSEISTLEEARLYVTQKYLFTVDIFVIIAKLDDRERKIFIIKHCVSAIYQEMYTFLTEAEKVLYKITPEIEYILVESSARILINILKLSEVTGTPIELHDHVWHFRSDYKDLLKFAAKISAQCEKFDRTNRYAEENFRDAIKQLLYHFIKILNFEKLCFYKEMYKVISIII